MQKEINKIKYIKTISWSMIQVTIIKNISILLILPWELRSKDKSYAVKSFTGQTHPFLGNLIVIGSFSWYMYITSNNIFIWCNTISVQCTIVASRRVNMVNIIFAEHQHVSIVFVNMLTCLSTLHTCMAVDTSLVFVVSQKLQYAFWLSHGERK